MKGIPKAAVKCSMTAMKVLKKIYGVFEQHLRNGMSSFFFPLLSEFEIDINYVLIALDSSCHGTSTPFHRTDPTTHRSFFKVCTDPHLSLPREEKFSIIDDDNITSIFFKN